MAAPHLQELKLCTSCDVRLTALQQLDALTCLRLEGMRGDSAVADIATLRGLCSLNMTHCLQGVAATLFLPITLMQLTVLTKLTWLGVHSPSGGRVFANQVGREERRCTHASPPGCRTSLLLP